jgi:hypothetical protein
MLNMSTAKIESGLESPSLTAVSGLKTHVLDTYVQANTSTKIFATTAAFAH